MSEVTKQSEETIPTTMDAQIWAKDFGEYYKKIYNQEIDQDWMLGWFANSIMAGFDEANRRNAREEKWVYVLKNWQTGETVAVYSEQPSKQKCDRDYSLHLGSDLEWSLPNFIYVSGQDSSWNCTLEKRKVDSLNRLSEEIKIKDLELYDR